MLLIVLSSIYIKIGFIIIMLREESVVMNRASWNALPPKPGIKRLKLDALTKKIILTQIDDEQGSCFTSVNIVE